MILTTEELGDIPDVSAADIDQILSADSFGKFVILSASEASFIQAGSDWQPTPECQAFLAKHDSDPWLLEYRDEQSGRQFRAARHVTLDEVRRAFLSYLGGGGWRRAFEWKQVLP